MFTFNIKALIFALFCCLFSAKINAQAFDSAKFVGTVQPQYLAVNGLRADAEIRIRNNPYNWFGIGFQANVGKVNLDRSASTRFISFTKQNTGDDLWGCGIDVYYKTFLASKAQKKRSRKSGRNKKNQPLIYTSPFYMAFGAGYKYYEIDYSDAGWVEYNDGGIKYYSYESPSGHMAINAVLGNLHFGKRIFLRNDVTVFDVYAGLGYRQAYVTSTAEGFRDFSRNYWDYGFNGLYPMAGVKMGFIFQ